MGHMIFSYYKLTQKQKERWACGEGRLEEQIVVRLHLSPTISFSNITGNQPTNYTTRYHIVKRQNRLVPLSAPLRIQWPPPLLHTLSAPTMYYIVKFQVKYNKLIKKIEESIIGLILIRMLFIECIISVTQTCV